MKVAIVKYNAGNIYSVVNALRRLGVEPMLTDKAEEIMSAERVIFPGQGEASNAMAYLREHRLDEVIRSLKQPVLGICIGQQLLCQHSEEGDTDCIGVFPLDVKRFNPERHEDKVPQMGWNSIHDLKSPLFKGINENDFIYNVHSFYVPQSEFTIATCDYILPYSAALNKDNFYTCQFHPEKSGEVGQQIIQNFLETLPHPLP
ncbi:MAG: imidazole glycerol phosphate synthase subunit HisH [Prevotellaceae bacterium]|nr:imidazole glycerol phosphate synthase subunit HisH [Prevotellaceae bacterium]